LAGIFLQSHTAEGGRIGDDGEVRSPFIENIRLGFYDTDDGEGGIPQPDSLTDGIGAFEEILRQ
jgi:hypothetical protein